MKNQKKTSSSVRELVEMLEHPIRFNLKRREEPSIDIEQVRKNMKLKWKDPGYCNFQFSNTPCVRSKILNQWQISRMNMATRSYITPKGSQPIRFDKQSRQFPKLTLNAYPPSFQKRLVEMQKERYMTFSKSKRATTQSSSTINTLKQNQKSRIYTFKPSHESRTLFGFETKTYFSRGNDKLKTIDV